MADYSYDRVYGPSDVTSTVYDECVGGVVKSFVDGYHGSVFAYGQVRERKGGEVGWVGRLNVMRGYFAAGSLSVPPGCAMFPTSRMKLCILIIFSPFLPIRRSYIILLL